MALRILSYNILEGGSDRLPFIASVILQQQPDVIALLEARSLPNVEALAQQLGMQSAVGEAGNKNKDNVTWLSRFPIVRAENHPLTLSKTLLEIEIQWEDVPLTLFATHLKAGQNQEREQERIAEMSAILRFLHAYPNQFHALVGDLNTVHPDDQVDVDEWVAIMKERGAENPVPQFPRQVIPLLLEAGYTDCYRTIHPAAPGYSMHTAHPALRIDYIFASPSLAQHLFACDLVTGGEAEQASDHFPVWAEFR